MQDRLRLLVIPLIISLAGCNFPVVQDKVPAPSIPALEPSATPVVDPATETPEPASTDPAQANTPSPETSPLKPLSTAYPALPDPEIDPHPLLPPGAEISFEMVQLIDSKVGWGITRGEDEFYSLLRTEDGGYTWRDISPPHPILPGTFGRDLVVHFHDSDNGWVNFLRSSILWRTEDGGIQWEPVPLPFSSDVGARTEIRSINQDQVWIFQHINVQGLYTGEEFHAVSRSIDGGRTWKVILDPILDPSLNPGSKTGFDILDAEYGWLVRSPAERGESFGVDFTIDGGVSWRFVELPPPEFPPEVYPTCAYSLSSPRIFNRDSGLLKVYINCDAGENAVNQDYLYRTEDGGISWQVSEMPNGRLEIISDLLLFSIGRDIYRSEDGGQSWELIKDIGWSGNLSFASPELALGVVFNPQTGASSLVKTYNGCSTFVEIAPEVWTSLSVR